MSRAMEKFDGHERQAAHEIADVSSQHLTATRFQDTGPVWIACEKQTEDLDSFLGDYGISVADAPLVLPLKYGLYEVWVKSDRRVELEKLFPGEIYEQFDAESALVRFCGRSRSVTIVCNAYKRQSKFWGGMDKIVNDRMGGLNVDRARI